MNEDERYMRRCIELANQARKNGDVPVGALVVNRDGEIVGEGFNCRERDKSSLCHAELIAIDEASKCLHGWRLIGCTLYVTLEPCAMCAGAVVNSRIERVVYGTKDNRFGACGTCFNLFEQGLNHTPEIVGGVLQGECASLLTDFFRELRLQKQAERK
ncbi:MAG: tRNA adenosine(34) deaminase TadA [Ruminococcus sp.]|nr:tRNA adenosine(34) deaminase TadA [Ruminococcus sp.]